MSWYLAVLRNYTGFSGRASRTEYWMFTLVNFLALVALWILYAIAHAAIILLLIYEFGVLLPGLAVTFRRLHDTDRSGWWVLLSVIPLIGAIVLLVFLCIDSNPGENRYGSNPKGLAPA